MWALSHVYHDVWACSYQRWPDQVAFSGFDRKNNKLKSTWMDQRFWYGERSMIQWVGLYLKHCAVRRLYCIGFHFHKTKAERTEEVVIIYDDTQDLGAKNGFHFHKYIYLHGGKSMAFMRFPLIIIWRVLIGGVLQKSLLLDPSPLFARLVWNFEMLAARCLPSYGLESPPFDMHIYTYSKTVKQFLLVLDTTRGN